MSDPVDPFIPFVPGPANPNVPGSLTHTLLNFNFGTKVSVADVGFSIAGLDGSQLLPLANVPPLTHTNVTDFGAAASAAAPVQSVAGFTADVTVSQLASVIPMAQAGTPKGLYDPVANTPTLSANGGGGSVGDVYQIDNAGTMTIDGVGALTVGNRIQCINVSSGVNRWVPILTPQGAGTFTAVSTPIIVQGPINSDTSATVASFAELDQDAGWNNIRQVRSNDGATLFAKVAFQDFSGADWLSMASTGMALGEVVTTVAYNIPGNPLEIDVDPNGFWMGGVDAFGVAFGRRLGAASSTYSPSDISARDAYTLASNVDRQVPFFNQPVANYNIVISYGQSLSNGTHAGPTLSRTPSATGNVMIGTDVRGDGTDPYVPVDNANFNLVQSRMQNVNVGPPYPLIPYSGEAAFIAGGTASLALSETLVEVFLEDFKVRRARRIGMSPTDTSKVMVGGALGRGGETIAFLSTGTQYGRIATHSTAVKTAATALSATSDFIGTLWVQGEADLATSTATYQAALITLQQQIAADTALGIFSQTQVPPFLMYQSPALSRSTNVGGPAYAQLALALTMPGFYMASPIYQFIDYGFHMPANSYRWLGAHMARVLDLILAGKDWQPLHVTQATYRGTQGLISIKSRYPLTAGTPYLGTLPQHDTAGNLGFMATDDTGDMQVTAQIVGDATILINFPRAPSTNLMWRYGDADNNNALGFVCDTDPDVSPTGIYTYLGDGNGQLVGENVAAWVGLPYRLQNWLPTGSGAFVPG